MERTSQNWKIKELKLNMPATGEISHGGLPAMKGAAVNIGQGSLLKISPTQICVAEAMWRRGWLGKK